MDNILLTISPPYNLLSAVSPDYITGVGAEADSTAAAITQSRDTVCTPVLYTASAECCPLTQPGNNLLTHTKLNK